MGQIGRPFAGGALLYKQIRYRVFPLRHVSMRRQLRCREVWGRQPRTRAAIDEDGDGAVGEHLQRLAPEHDSRNAAPAMGRHHDQIACLGIGGLDNRFVRMLVLDMHNLATYPRGIRGLLHLRQALCGYGSHALPVRLESVCDHVRFNRKKMEGGRNRYARHLGVNGLRQGCTVLNCFVGQVRAIGWNEDVRVHKRSPSKKRLNHSGAIALAILHSTLRAHRVALHHRSDETRTWAT